MERDRSAVNLHLSAVALHQLGRLREAEADARRALALLLAGDGTEVEISDLLSDLAAILDSAGRHAEAEGLHRHASTLLVELPAEGAHDRQRIRCARGLAGNVHAQGRAEEAHDVLVPALAYAEQLLGPDDPDTLATMVDLAAVCARLGYATEAEALHRQALARFELVWPARTAQLAGVAAGLSLLLEADGKLGEAAAVARRALTSAAGTVADPLGDGMRPLRLAELVQATLGERAG